MSEEEPKIIVDEGWKAQVQREKELAAAKPAEEEAPVAETPVTPDLPVPDVASEGEEEEEASFTALVGSLATQIMFALGLVADPNDGQVMVNLDAARYTLDALAILEEKTQGNLTTEETETLTQARTELEQVFTVRVQQFQEQAMQEAGVDMNNLKG